MGIGVQNQTHPITKLTLTFSAVVRTNRGGKVRRATPITIRNSISKCNFLTSNLVIYARTSGLESSFQVARGRTIGSCSDSVNILTTEGITICCIQSTGRRTGYRRLSIRLSGNSSSRTTCSCKTRIPSNIDQRSFKATQKVHSLCYLRTSSVVLVLRQSDCSQNTDDGNYDHQFDQGKTLLHLSFHDSLRN